MQDVTIRGRCRVSFQEEQKSCAEAVAKAWLKVSGKDPELKENLSVCGSGRAPHGMRGAVYAVQLLSCEDEAAELSSRFADAVGSLFCREIRALRK